MNVAVLAPPWFAVPPTGYGGIEWIVWLLADGLVDAGHHVTLFASGDSRTKARLVAVYPDARDHQWNDGRLAGPGRHDDMAFLRGLIGRLVEDRIADAARIYVTGPSNGGMMTLRLACEAAELIAAAAPIIASLPADLARTCKPARPDIG